MNDTVATPNPAEQASERALAEVFQCLERGESFLLEAGAGAGKTYSLVKALQFLIKREQYNLPRRHQKIACITFTNVARDEIAARTDRSPLIYCDTVHAFCWANIHGFQRQIRDQLPNLPHWPEKIAEAGAIGERRVEYSLGHRSIKVDHLSLHHDDVLLLAIFLLGKEKFRRILVSKYPIILIDEYQDTNRDWIESIKTHFLGKPGSPLFGFFGDHWQKIYGDGCGKIEHPGLHVIGKRANFRTVTAISDCLNRMRPELPQFVVDPDAEGSVRIFHTNDWEGQRQTGQHWGGDLPNEIAASALQAVIGRLECEDWDFSPAETKILMLTHRGLANKLGYSSLPSVFTYNDSFAKKADIHISYFADTLEPACEAFLARKYGQMFLALGSNVPTIKSQVDKEKWASSMRRLVELRSQDTTGAVLDHLRKTKRPRIPDALEQRDRELALFDRTGGAELPRSLSELEALRAVPYQEVIALCRYLAGHSPFETKHGVKGAQFKNVLVVVGRGWNQYNFNEMLELASDPNNIPANKVAAFERNRNLFYVACSRPQQRLSVLFTQKLSDVAMRTLTSWFGAAVIEPLEF